MIALATPFVSGRAHGDGVAIETGGAEPMRFTATLVVNAAGLDAQAVARAIDGLPPDKIPPLFLAKGNYFSLTVRSPFSRLVYPMPAPGGLGVHLTLDLAGQARFGPDVEWVRDDRLRRRPAARRILLCRDPDLLARSAGRRVAAGLRRNPPEDCSPWRVVDRFSHPDGTRSRRPRACQSVRHRVPRPYGEPRDRRRDREAALITRPFVGRPQPPVMTSPATTVAACPFRIRARKSSRFPATGPRAY